MGSQTHWAAVSSRMLEHFTRNLNGRTPDRVRTAIHALTSSLRHHNIRLHDQEEYNLETGLLLIWHDSNHDVQIRIGNDGIVSGDYNQLKGSFEPIKFTWRRLGDAGMGAFMQRLSNVKKESRLQTQAPKRT